MCNDAAMLEPIWSLYSEVCRPSSVEYLSNYGGFSGARIWRTETKLGPLCLRAWPPEQPTERQLSSIHATLRRVRGQGLRFVPAPLRTADGDTIVRYAGHLWELSPWMPGVADYHARPTRERLETAMRALARFHLAAAACDAPEPIAPSPTLRRRLRELRSFLNGPDAETLRRRVPDGRWPEMDVRAQRLIEHVEFRRSYLNELLEQPLPPVMQQPVIRDIWHDHVLFKDDVVTGMVDFGAMSVDTVAVDVSRLLGSLVEADGDAWNAGLRAYSDVRPLSMQQRDMLETLDKSGIFAGGLVWLRWHYLEYRTFENRTGMLARVDHFLNRLEMSDSAGRRVQRASCTAS